MAADKTSRRRRRWRRFRLQAGTVLMAMGAALILIFAGFAILLIGNFIEWDNSADALTTVAMLCAPPIGLALVMTLLGRLVYGGHDAGAPLLRGASWLLQVVGGAAGFTAGAAMILFILAGVGADERAAVIKLALGVFVGLGAAGVGWLVRPKNRTA